MTSETGSVMENRFVKIIVTRKKNWAIKIKMEEKFVNTYQQKVLMKVKSPNEVKTMFNNEL